MEEASIKETPSESKHAEARQGSGANAASR